MAIDKRTSRRMTKLLTAAALTALASPAMAQVSSVNLTFNGTEGGFSNTGFDAAYNPDASGYNVNFGGNSKLGILTLDGDTFGNYENDPDTAKNMFYKNFNVGDRTVVEARVNVLNLNANYHGGGIWIGTDQDHYIRLGLINHSGITQPDGATGSVSVEALRENEDRWTVDGTYPNRPGFDIESRYAGISQASTPNASNPSGRDITAILRLVRDRHAVAAYYSLDNGATFVRVGGETYSFNALATDATSLPIDNRTTADPNNADLTSHSVEGGFKIGAYGLGGGGAQRAVVQFDTFTGISDTPTYTGPASGEWTSGANWNNNNGIGAPTNIESTAVFPTAASARTITVSSDITATNVRFESAAGTTVSGTGLVRFDWFFFPTHPNYYSDGPGVVTVTAGTHTISAPSTVAHLHNFNISGGATLNLTNMVASPVDNLDAGIRKQGAGTMQINQLLTANAVVEAGTLRVTPNAASVVSRVRNINVTTTAGSTAKLDLTNNTVVVDYDASGTSPLASITAQLKSGFAGNWTGPGIVSSSAAADSHRAIGIAEASDLGTSVPAIFGTVDGTAVLLRYAYRGDSNIDGDVDFSDLVALAQNYNSTTSRWVKGDFNYDGATNFEDLVALAQNYNSVDAVTVGELAAFGSDFASDWALAQSIVPEPATLSALALAATAVMRRRRHA